MSLISGQAHSLWMAHSAEMKAVLEQIKDAEKIDTAREAFHQLSVELIALTEKFGISENQTLYKFHCPMAFNNQGADWLQGNEDIKNPYFGAAMLKCGQMTQVIKSENE